MKIGKISSYVMYAIFAIILAVLAMFYFVGYNNYMGELLAPAHTETLIFLMYALLGVTILLTVVAAIAQFIAALKDNALGAVKSLMGLVLLVALVLVAYGIGSAEPVLANGEPYEDKFWLKATDMWLYSTYILLAVAAVLAIINMTGIVKKIK